MKLANILLMMLLIVPGRILFVDAAGEDEILEEEEATVAEDVPEESAAGASAAEADAGSGGTQDAKDEAEADLTLKPSPEAETRLLFVQPARDGSALPAGSVVRLLVSLTNAGKKNFIVDSLDAAFRYPQDYSYYIQNFTAVHFEKVVEPRRQATFEYSFLPSENFNSRPFGLTVNLNYRDADGKAYQDAVFNQTVVISDPEEGFDTEAFFLYVVLAALGVLALVGVQQAFLSIKKKTGLAAGSGKPIETGTQNNHSDIDYDWIPKETLNASARRSPSPRQRKGGNRSSSGEE